MKKEKFLNAVEKIEDHFITEAEVYDPEKAKKKLSPGFFIVPAAAAASVALILGVNSMYDKHDPLSNPEIDNYPVSDTAGISEYVTTGAPGYTGTEITYSTGTETVSEVTFDTVTATETDITVTGSETEIIKTEGSNATAAPSTQKTERQEPAPETARKTEPPVTERQAVPEPTAEAEVTTEFHSKPQPAVTTEERAVKPEPPTTTGERISPEPPPPPSTTTENEKETPEPPVTLQPSNPSNKTQPLPFANYEEAIRTVNSYDPDDYPEYSRQDYIDMFGRIISDGFIYAPDDEDNELMEINSPVTLYPYAAYEDIGAGCIPEYDGAMFQTTFYCADRDVLSSSANQADYFKNRLNQEFEISWLSGSREVFIKDIGVWHCAYAFIDDEHYFIIRTTDSEEALLRFLSDVKFKQIPLS
ncbi:MAG: hypothetical protein J5864_04835 [Oscillospiraceae bacterium]|nr:hypothetical protein [Oscillospiraceae bacterium]